jgi:cholesterol transport system auxiliary component
MRRHMRWVGAGVFLCVVLVLLSGCAAKGGTVKTYTIDPKYAQASYPGSPYLTKSLKVAYPSHIRGKASSNIFFSYSDLQWGVYQRAYWAASNSQLLTSATIEALQHAKIFKMIVDYNSLSNTDYLLESQVYDFYHKIREGRSSSIVSIRYDLISTDYNRLIKSHLFTYEVPTKTTDAKGYVDATNKALEMLSGDLIGWLCR